MNREELEETINELILEYYENQDLEIPKQIVELGRQLRELDH